MGDLSILFVGDVFGKAGMEATRQLLRAVQTEHGVDFTIANGENSAGGIGLTPETTRELLSRGVDVVTTGNHVWRQKEIRGFIEKERRLLRPANLPKAQPGRGFAVYDGPLGVRIAVINLIGRIFMDPAGSPFEAAEQALAELGHADVVVVDFHAEATSEKRAMGYFLDGRVAAVVGTHTHVQTADEQLLPGGTAFLTDLGMTGPHDSIIGMRKDVVIERFVTGMPHSFQAATEGARFQGAVVTVDTSRGRATGIRRVDVAL